MPKRPTATCPECGQASVRICECPLADAFCPFEHHYFRCLCGKVVTRQVEHARDARACRCHKSPKAKSQ